MSETKELPAGWAFPPSSRKAHYFPADEGTSLCGRWGFQFNAAAREPDNGKPSKDDCAACRRNLAALAAPSPAALDRTGASE